MIYHLLTILLAPLFLIQGVYVRRVTPKLPEAAGHRSGVSGSGPHTSLLILGDSAAAGVGVNSQEQALSGRLVNKLSARYQVSWALIANTGDDSAKVLDRLKTVARGPFDTVVLSVGVNDVTGRLGTAEWARNLQCIIDALKMNFTAQHIYFTGLPPMHAFPALPQPLRWWLGKRARTLNAIMTSVAQSNEGCALIQPPFSFDLQYMAEDGFHPGGPAYSLWADMLAEHIQAAIRSG